MDNKGWFVAQVRERYVAGSLTLDQFERDLAAAVKLDEGLLPDRVDVPNYLRARDGHLLIGLRVGA